MTQDTQIREPILQQVLETMFEIISKGDDFDPVTIEKLRRNRLGG